MFHYEFTFRSLTTAQTGRNVLRAAGVNAELLRAPSSMSRRGCGYVLRVPGAYGAYSASALRSAGLHYAHSFLLHANAEPEEVSL